MLRVTSNGDLVKVPEKTDKPEPVKEVSYKRTRQKSAAAPKPKPEKPPKPEIPEIRIPAALAKTQTTQAVASGSYAKKLKAHFSNVLLPSMFQSLHRQIESDSLPASKLVSEIYALQPQNKAPLVQVNQTNDNSRTSVKNDNRSVNIATPDEMFRLLAADREKRALGPAPMEFTVIPENVKAAVEED